MLDAGESFAYRAGRVCREPQARCTGHSSRCSFSFVGGGIPNKMSRWSGVAYWALLLISAWFLLRRVLLVVLVEGASMVPTLHYGDRVLVWRLCPHRWLHRGRIVVVEHEADRARARWSSPQEPALYVKRVVGLPGDTVQWSPDTVPAGHLFVCGDNRPGSRDSRHWGPLPLHSLRGIVLAKLPGKQIVIRMRLQDGTYVTDVRRAARSPHDVSTVARRSCADTLPAC